MSINCDLTVVFEVQDEFVLFGLQHVLVFRRRFRRITGQQNQNQTNPQHPHPRSSIRATGRIPRERAAHISSGLQHSRLYLDSSLYASFTLSDSFQPLTLCCNDPITSRTQTSGTHMWSWQTPGNRSNKHVQVEVLTFLKLKIIK